MECSICDKAFDGNIKRRKPTCCACAQALSYAPRIQHAHGLLDREKQHTHAEAILRSGNDGVIAALPEDADWEAISAGVKKVGLHKIKEERETVEGRIDEITEKSRELRQQIESYREYFKEQREWHVQRRQALNDARSELDKQRRRVLEPVQSSSHKAAQRLEKVRSRTIDARSLLCREAAVLSGLRRQRRADGKSQYWLGGVPLPDLRDLNGGVRMSSDGHDNPNGNPTHDGVTASMDNVCRLLANCCHYLSVRLPSEVILPHRDFPHALIMPEKASYKLQDIPYPRSTSQSSSPAASRLLDLRVASLPRARPLHLDRPLRDLAKEDFKAFSLFIEGVTLLAWDLAWLCRMQGLDSVNSFDDFCTIGRNLHRLFLGQDSSRLATDRNHSAATTKADHSKGTNVSTARLGSHSHNSAYHSLSGHEGLELLNNWRLASSARVADKLKSFVMNEITGAEWDFLSDKEWDEDRADEQPVLVGGQRKTSTNYDPAMSVMTVAPHNDSENAGLSDSRQKYNKGWMKVRGRGGDA